MFLGKGASKLGRFEEWASSLSEYRNNFDCKSLLLEKHFKVCTGSILTLASKEKLGGGGSRDVSGTAVCQLCCEAELPADNDAS